jgi:hypothetical protein
MRRHRSFELYDATISYPTAARDTVPSWAAFLIPFVLLVLTVSCWFLQLSPPDRTHSLGACVLGMLDS